MQDMICVEPLRVPDKQNSWYGTRTATVLLVTRAEPRRVVYVERDMYTLDKDGRVLSPEQSKRPERRFEFTLRPAQA